jgi:hypothetical protein
MTLAGALVLTVSAAGIGSADQVNDSDIDVVQRPLTGLEFLSRLAAVAPDVVESLDHRELRRMLKSLGELAVSESVPSAISCGVFDGDTQVDDGDIDDWDETDVADWCRYNSGGTEATAVDFFLLPLFTGSPLRLHHQRFRLDPASATNIVTPCGVPFWASDATSGRWVLLVRNNAGDPINFCVTEVIAD